MASIIKKFIGDNEVGYAKIRLENNSFLRGRNAADSADVNIAKIDSSDRVFLGDSGGYLVVGAQNNADPGSAVAGEVYYNTTSNKLRYYDGSAWSDIGGATGANTTLSNLTSPTAINQDLLLTSTKTLRLPNNVYLKARNAANSADIDILKVDTSDFVAVGVNVNPAVSTSYGLGTYSQRWAQVTSEEVRVSNTTTALTKLIINTTSPSGVSLSGALLGGDDSSTISRAVGVYSLGWSSALATGNVVLETGNNTGAGNSGGISIKTGTSTGGSRGNISIDAPTITTYGVFQPSGNNTLSLGGTSLSFSTVYGNIFEGRVGTTILWSGLNGNRALLAVSGTSDSAANVNTATFGTGDQTSTGTGSIGLASFQGGDIFSSSNANTTGAVILRSGNTLGTGTTGTLTIRTGNITKAAADNTSNTGAVTISTGTTNATVGTPTTGAVTISTGTPTGTNCSTGSISIATGTATGTGTRGTITLDAGSIILNPGTTGNIKVYNHIYPAAGGGPSDSGSLDLGNNTFVFRSATVNSYTVRAASVNYGFMQNFTTPTGMSAWGLYGFQNTFASTGIMTRNGGFETGKIFLETGNSTAANLNSGSVACSTGTTVAGTGVTGSFTFTTGNAAGSGDSGSFTFTTGTSATGNRGGFTIDARYLLLPKLAAAPSSPVAGWMYYDTTNNKSYTYDGTTWQAHW